VDCGAALTALTKEGNYDDGQRGLRDAEEEEEGGHLVRVRARARARARVRVRVRVRVRNRREAGTWPSAAKKA